jgi:hypothetical protein
VRARDADAVREWLARTAEVRRALPAQWVPQTAKLCELGCRCRWCCRRDRGAVSRQGAA